MLGRLMFAALFAAALVPSALGARLASQDLLAVEEAAPGRSGKGGQVAATTPPPPPPRSGKGGAAAAPAPAPPAPQAGKGGQRTTTAPPPPAPRAGKGGLKTTTAPPPSPAPRARKGAKKTTTAPPPVTRAGKGGLKTTTPPPAPAPRARKTSRKTTTAAPPPVTRAGKGGQKTATAPPPAPAPRARKGGQKTTTALPMPVSRAGKGGQKTTTAPVAPAPRARKGGQRTTTAPPPVTRAGKGGQQTTSAPLPAPAPRARKGGQKTTTAAPPAPPSAEEAGALVKEMRERVRAAREKRGGKADTPPDFARAAARLVKLEEFAKAKVVRVHMNSRSTDLRVAALKAGKKLLVSTGTLSGFRLVDGAKVKKGKYEEAASMAYAMKFGEELDIDAKIRVDLFVIASMAVNPVTGCRVSPPGYSEELEYGLLRQMRALRPKTPVVTIVDASALVKGMSLGSGGPLCSTVSADIIVTPTRATVVGEPSPKLKGIDFDRIGAYRIGTMRLLRRLRAKMQGKTPVEPKKAPAAKKKAAAPAATARSGKGGRGAFL